MTPKSRWNLGFPRPFRVDRVTHCTHGRRRTMTSIIDGRSDRLQGEITTIASPRRPIPRGSCDQNSRTKAAVCRSKEFRRNQPIEGEPRWIFWVTPGLRGRSHEQPYPHLDKKADEIHLRIEVPANPVGSGDDGSPPWRGAYLSAKVRQTGALSCALSAASSCQNRVTYDVETKALDRD